MNVAGYSNWDQWRISSSGSHSRLRMPKCAVPRRYELGRAAVAQQNLLWPPSLVCLAARTLSPAAHPIHPT
jgi:hypothetical protein